MGLDLLSTFVLPRYIFVVFPQKKIQTTLLKTLSRGCVRTPTLHVVLVLLSTPQSYDTERKAHELMEEACSELTRVVEEDQAEVELLRRECLRMQEDMEEERQMLQMAEVWREERVQMKLADAKLALKAKYAQLAHLQAEMEAFLRTRTRTRTRTCSCHSSTPMREARFIVSDAAARPRGGGGSGRASSQHDDDDEVDADSVFEHFRCKEETSSPTPSNASAMMQSPVIPATDLFLAKVDNGGSSSTDMDMDYDGGRDSCS
ncbi:uncharacterized protein LOC120701366 [Panicum virgatum]|uniref:Uncharacterized protein n=1 Tax=Panicum virgatum TaxID=38727 RepID=A0A8T0UTG5_PANVG|nr:uncharacterized protein LOC120701366 [Panicum virgatum]KAG2627632.1 hypothetical protein PVAP13_3KG262100 [Panicum virgatum]